MQAAGSPAQTTSIPRVNTPYAVAYRALAYPGLFSVFGSLLYGFRYNPAAQAGNYLINLMLYAVFVAPHLVMTRAWFKRALWGNPAGSPRERRVYISVTLLTWFVVLWFHQPLPGGALSLPTVLRFIGVIGFLMSFLMFFQGITFQAVDGLLGVPGSVSAYSHGLETPLFTEGAYAQVRHPMYRAVVLMGVSALIIHPNLAQVFWTAIIGVTFIGFIPAEEAQMIAARGDDYREYMRRVPYRLFRGIW